MRKTIAVTLTALGVFLLILSITFTVVQLTVSRTVWFEQTFEKLGLAEQMGMTLGDLGASIRTLVDYLNGRTGTIDVLVTVNGQQVRMFNLAIEAVHMEEVRTLWQRLSVARNIGILLGLLLALLGLLADMKDIRRTLARGYMWAMGVFLVFVAFVGTWAAFSFDGFWTAFHRVIFPNSENWLLPANSRMINMLPSELFRALVLRIGGRTLLVLLILGVPCGAPHLIRLYKQREADQGTAASRAPVQSPATVPGPDMIQAHLKANMSVTERNKLNETLARQATEGAQEPQEEDMPEAEAVRFAFAPLAEAEEEEPDDDYDDLL